MLRHHRTIRAQLTYLVLACVIPVWLIAGFLVLRTYLSKVNEINGDMLEAARAMTMHVDQELTKVQAALSGLATSPSFRKAEFQEIHRQAQELLKSFPGADIIVADESGQQLVNSFRPYGSPLPKRNNPAMVQTIFRTGKPVISNLFFGAVTKRPLIAVDIPVFLDGKVAYDLSMTFSSDRLSGILLAKKLPTGGFCEILDGNRVIVARTMNPQLYVGRQAPPAIREAMKTEREGTANVTGGTGKAVLSAFSMSSTSGWSVTLGVPRSTVMAATYSWIAWSIAGATAISLIGIVLAMRYARRIAGDIQSLVEPALAIGRGEIATAASVRWVKETAEVAEALVQASELRLKAMEELRKQEQLLVQQSRQAALGEMIGNIAHQWRQPLNTLALLAQQPPLYFECGEISQEYLDKHAQKSMEIIQHMSCTIDDFRHFFMPNKEKVAFKVRGEVARTLSLIEGSFKSHETAIEVVTHGDPDIVGYPNEFSQVLLNILVNARDAMAERKITEPKVVITIGTQGSRSVVTIADNAGGIPEEIIDKIFDPYFTTKGPHVGTGVGLFMSKTIIEKNMGGRLTVRNVEDGAEFRIEV